MSDPLTDSDRDTRIHIEIAYYKGRHGILVVAGRIHLAQNYHLKFSYSVAICICFD